MAKRNLICSSLICRSVSHRYVEVRMNSQTRNTGLLGLSVTGSHNSIQTTVLGTLKMKGSDKFNSRSLFANKPTTSPDTRDVKA
jgi:hypothetical protein